jgi:hypothetical protein
MKNLTFLIFVTVLTVFASCQDKFVKTKAETTQKDTTTKLSETKIYILQKETVNSDFNYSKLDNIDAQKMETLNLKNIMPVFEPISGHYKYYQFLATFIGEGYNSDGPPLIKEFHDILIVKTDNENKIIDAYQYTLEWAEPPLQNDVYKSSIKNISLTNNMEIKQLKFRRTISWNDNNKVLNESGVLKLK